jgi:hypothetical protein
MIEVGKVLPDIKQQIKSGKQPVLEIAAMSAYDRADKLHRSGIPEHSSMSIESGDWQGTVERLICSCGWSSEWFRPVAQGDIRRKYAGKRGAA